MRSTKTKPAKPAPRVPRTPPALPVVPVADETAALLAPSTPQPIAFAQLRRAPENVRHVLVDEDVTSLADDIQAHGLLQSLIGYEADASWPEDAGRIMIVGGGRRLQALKLLYDRGVIDDAYTVPVLLRGVEEAVELSLAENLQQRTMSPVDEFLAFKALMDTGHHSPEGLAARFGFSERVVKQRLRLADVVPEVLDALATKRITIDAATAYAATSDRTLQLEVFKVQDRKGWEPHRPANIKHDIQTKGMRTTDPIFRFVTAEIYERDGGGYEDDLFAEGTDRNRDGQTLDRPFIAKAAAERTIDFQAIRLIEELKRDPKLAPTIVGHVRPENLRIYSWGCGDKTPAPKGFVEIDRRYGDTTKMWKTIRNNGIDVHVVVGINDRGELQAYTNRLFVPKDQKNAVDPQQPQNAHRQPTPEERAAEQRKAEIEKLSKRYAVGSFAGTPLEGRAYWPLGGWMTAAGERKVVDGRAGWVIPVLVYVTEDEIAAQEERATADADAAIAQCAAEKKRIDDVLALDPGPVAIVVDGLVHYRWAYGGYWDAREPADEDAEPAEDLLGAHTLHTLVHNADVVGEWWPTIEAFAAREQGGDQ